MKSLFENLFEHKVNSKEDVIKVLNNAVINHVIDADALPIMESLMNISSLRAEDIMIPRSDVDVIDINDTMEIIAQKIIATGHSRFPVIDGDISDIIGMFHSKDLIQYFINPEDFNLRDMLRKAYFVPEIKHLDALMYEMRLNHSHMAIVVDEFTNVAGVVTLEMIVEQILGEIEDEHDSVDGEREIVELSSHVYRVKGMCKLNTLNTIIGLNWIDEHVETVSGFLVKFLGRVPELGEVLEYETIKIEIVNSNSRKINLLRITKNL